MFARSTCFRYSCSIHLADRIFGPISIPEHFLWLAYYFDGVIPVSLVRVLHVGLGIGPSVLLLLPRPLSELHPSVSPTLSRPVDTVVGTGACSGIGLAITQCLSFQRDTTWHTLLADLNEDAFSAICPILDLLTKKGLATSTVAQ